MVNIFHDGLLERELVPTKVDNPHQREFEGLSRGFDTGEEVVDFLDMIKLTFLCQMLQTEYVRLCGCI